MNILFFFFPSSTFFYVFKDFTSFIFIILNLKFIRGFDINLTTTAIDKQFRLYAPQSTKSYTTNDDGSLIIEGIASTTNKDLQGDIVLPSAIESMKNQLLSTSKNLHGDHKYGLDSILGVVKEVLDSDDNTLIIKAVIRKTYAPTIKEMLDIGINLGLSIGGNITDYNPRKDGWEIKDINLFEISLTGMPANFDV